MKFYRKAINVPRRGIEPLRPGKKSLRLDKVNQVLQLFGYEVGAIPTQREIISDEKS
jgi:hypothetical protein